MQGSIVQLSNTRNQKFNRYSKTPRDSILFSLFLCQLLIHFISCLSCLWRALAKPWPILVDCFERNFYKGVTFSISSRHHPKKKMVVEREREKKVCGIWTEIDVENRRSDTIAARTQLIPLSKINSERQAKLRR